MPLSEDDARDVVAYLLKVREAELRRLDRIKAYMDGEICQVYSPTRTHHAYRRLVDMSKVNVLPLVVSAFAENLFAEGYRGKRAKQNTQVWDIWQDNRMDQGQGLIYRSALTYGLAYATVLKKKGGGAIIEPYSPREMTAVYRNPTRDEWPVYAISCSHGYDSRGKPVIRIDLYDSEWRYRFRKTADNNGHLEYVAETSEDGEEASGAHGLPETPVVRWLNAGRDLDSGPVSEIEPLMPLQDQVDNTTYSLLVTQQFAAFRQRWVSGMAIEEDADGNPRQPFDIGQDRLLHAESPDTKFGEFEASSLQQYLDSRQSTLSIMAARAQISPHAFLVSTGTVANLSAEALAALESSEQRKLAEMKTSFGESDEQLLRLCGAADGIDGAWEDRSSQMVWRDTESRSLTQVADAGNKLSSLSIPPEFLWEWLADALGWSQQDLERLKDLAAKKDGLKDQLNQAIPPAPPPEQLIGQGASNVVPAGPAGPARAARTAGQSRAGRTPVGAGA